MRGALFRDLTMKQLVIEGVGAIAERTVAAAAQKLHIDIPDLKVFFTDKSANWTEDVRVDREATVRRINSWGAKFLDKSDPAQFAEYNDLLYQNVDAVLVETPDRTHIEIAKHWLKGNCEWIYIEKPLTTHRELDKAEKWVEELRFNKTDRERLLAFDHYRARVHAQFRYADYITSILSFIGQLRRFRFFLLEDHSDSDRKYIEAQRRRNPKFKNRNGPIENEGRVDALREGLILDLMPHVLSVLEYFGDPALIDVRTIRSGIYTGVDRNPSKRAGIQNETFAAIEFDFNDYGGGRVRGEAYIGKGIGGSRRYAEMRGNVKVLEVFGSRGKLTFDFHNNTLLMGERSGKMKKMFDLERDAYYYLLTDVAFRKPQGTLLGLSIERATTILERLTHMKSKIDPAALGTYYLGDSVRSYSPWLEDLLHNGKNPMPLVTF